MILPGNSFIVQWLGLGAFTAGNPASIPGGEINIPQATWHGQKKKKVILPAIQPLGSCMEASTLPSMLPEPVYVFRSK